MYAVSPFGCKIVFRWKASIKSLLLTSFHNGIQKFNLCLYIFIYILFTKESKIFRNKERSIFNLTSTLKIFLQMTECMEDIFFQEIISVTSVSIYTACSILINNASILYKRQLVHRVWLLIQVGLYCTLIS